ncbi:MAG: hypothetical protein H0V90_11235 [Blastocatellia bacterium]|nr:hypothetical protein [Blastocatellia bacterium]
MKTRIAILIFCISVFAFPGYGQGNTDYSDSDSKSVPQSVPKSVPKSVTNANLEKFRRNRVKALKELRENYDQLGFPSPKEMARQNEKSRVEMAELSARFEAERLERERLAAQIAAESRKQNDLGESENPPNFSPQYRDRYYEWYGGGYSQRNRRGGYYNLPGYGWPGSQPRFPSSRKRRPYWQPW